MSDRVIYTQYRSEQSKQMHRCRFGSQRFAYTRKSLLLLRDSYHFAFVVPRTNSDTINLPNQIQSRIKDYINLTMKKGVTWVYADGTCLGYFSGCYGLSFTVLLVSPCGQQNARSDCADAQSDPAFYRPHVSQNSVSQDAIIVC